MKAVTTRLFIFFLLCGGISSVFLGQAHGLDSEPVDLMDESKVLLKDARVYMSFQALEHAVKKYDELVFREPNNALILKEAGDAYLALRDYEKAKLLYNKAVFLKPYDSDFRLAWAKGLAANGRVKRAAYELKKIVKNYPDFLEARKLLVDYLAHDKKWRAAAEEQAKVVVEKPDDTAELLKEAKFLNWAGQWNEAIPLYERLAARDPNNKEVSKELGLLYSWTRQWKKSQVTFEKLATEHPKDVEIKEELKKAHLFDPERSTQTASIYARIAQSNPSLARELSPSLREAVYIEKPTLSYSSVYYAEKDNFFHTKSRSYYHTIEYAHPFFERFKGIVSTTTRYNPTLKMTSQIVAPGLQTKISENLSHFIQLSFEPGNYEINPRFGIRNSLSWSLDKRLRIDMYDQFTIYWNGNESNSVGIGPSFFLLPDRDLVLSYRFSHDWIERPSDFFVSIDVQEGHTLDVFTHTFNAEKYWALGPNLTLTTGATHSLNTDEKNSWAIYGNINWEVVKNLRLITGVSKGGNNRKLRTFSASSYLSYQF